MERTESSWAVDSDSNHPPPSQGVQQIRETNGRGNGQNPPRSLAVNAQPVSIYPRIGELRPTISVTYAKKLARRMSTPHRSNRISATPTRQLTPVGSLSYEPLPAGPTAAGAVAQRRYRLTRPDIGKQPADVGTEFHNVLGSNYSARSYDRRPAPGIAHQYPNPALPASNERLDAVNSPPARGIMIRDGQPPSISGNVVEENRPPAGSAGNPIAVDPEPEPEPHRAGKEPVEGSSARPVDVETSNMKLFETMWSARAEGEGGRVVKGILFKNSPSDQVRLLCSCHGQFFSPEEFLKHAGAFDLSEPMKKITVSPFQI